MSHEFVVGIVSCSLVAYAILAGHQRGLHDVHKAVVAAAFLWAAAWSTTWFLGRGLPNENLSQIAGILISTPATFTLCLALAVYAAVRRWRTRQRAGELRG